MNIGLYAEMEDIDTMKVNDSALSIFLAMAQEESYAKSENIKLGIRAHMRSGKTILNGPIPYESHQVTFVPYCFASSIPPLKKFD